MKKLNVLVCGLLLGGLAFTGCSDDDDKKIEGEATVMANEYNEWTYFNFSTEDTVVLTIQKKAEGDGYVYEVDAEAEKVLKWDIAVHKYDMRTNGGLVKELSTKNFDAVTLADVPADGGMVADAEGSVMADMSQMMSGFVGYQDVKLNEELGRWVIATPTGTMPPYTYELNDNVFVVKVNGKTWKMQFSAYTYGGKTAARFVYGELK
ncbi:HmuY family protein [Odoribacter lunatus]|uniref:HmuY family protein n=1 Tax=Odoribacter lunatus TaxID=2941335 RepID=UPI00203C558E|nr:HmuY family protein [Odoribacter lunatus]